MLPVLLVVVDRESCHCTSRGAPAKPHARRLPHTLHRSMSASVRQMASSRILRRVSEAYGHMMLLDGLFQADCHPGNIIVMEGEMRGGRGV